MLGNEHKRELVIDTMASWALEGMEPRREALEGIREFVSGAVTVDEAIERVKARHAAQAMIDDSFSG